VYFVFVAKPAPQAEPETPAAVQPSEPVAEDAIVDVTDIDSLLDPPPTVPTGTPFDSPASDDLPARELAIPKGAAPPPIPPASD
jgi:hypothetical protein